MGSNICATCMQACRRPRNPKDHCGTCGVTAGLDDLVFGVFLMIETAPFAGGRVGVRTDGIGSRLDVAVNEMDFNRLHHVAAPSVGGVLCGGFPLDAGDAGAKARAKASGFVRCRYPTIPPNPIAAPKPEYTMKHHHVGKITSAGSGKLKLTI